MLGLRKGLVFRQAEPDYNLVLDGSARIDLPAGLRLDNKSFTVECFFKRVAGGGSEDYTILGDFSPENGTNNDKLHLLLRKFGDDYYCFFGAWFEDFHDTSTPILEDVWYKVGFVIDSVEGKRKIYLDSQVLNTVDRPTYQGVKPLTIGAWRNFQVRSGFAGEMSFFRVWDKALTISEFIALGSNKIHQQTTNLYANYNFNNDVLDSGGNDFHGTPFNESYKIVN
ncbi:MAG: LamG-like jellyroll fold domain-containing protein [Cyanobacteria bacterium P01_A01_bin.80]